MLRACSHSWVKAKKAIRKMWLRFTKGRLHLINLNSYCDESSGHAAKGTGCNTPWVSCGSWHQPLKHTQVTKMRPDGWLEWLKSCLGRQNWRLDGLKLLYLLARTVKVLWGWYRSMYLSLIQMIRQKVSQFMARWLKLHDLWGPLWAILWSANLWMILH